MMYIRIVLNDNVSFGLLLIFYTCLEHAFESFFIHSTTFSVSLQHMCQLIFHLSSVFPRALPRIFILSCCNVEFS